MMRRGHESASAPVAVGTVWGALSLGLPVLVAAVMGALVWRTCMWPDLDHPAKRGPLVWIVRWVSWRVWLMTRTAADRSKSLASIDKSKRKGVCAVIGRFMDRVGFLPRLRMIGDTHRDFTHSIEGAAVFGVIGGGCIAPLALLDSYHVSPGLSVFTGRVAEHALALASSIGMYAPCWGMAVFLGCLSHIGADSMTPSGVPVSMVMNRLLGYGTWQRWCFGWVWVPTRLTVPWVAWQRWHPVLRWVQVKYPRLSVLRVHGPRKECEHRGLFKTDSAGEKLLARPLLVAAALVMVAVATGVAGPMVGAFTAMMFGS
jgi:hypothetical protein